MMKMKLQVKVTVGYGCLPTVVSIDHFTVVCSVTWPLNEIKQVSDMKGNKHAKLLCQDILRTFVRKFSIFLKFLLQSGNELLISEMQKKSVVTDVVSEIKCVENFPDFENCACNSAWSAGVYS